MSNNSLSPIGSVEPCFPWGTAEAGEFLKNLSKMQAAAGILQLWYQDVSDLNDQMYAIEQSVRQEGSTCDTRPIGAVLANAEVGLSAEAPLIAIILSSTSDKTDQQYCLIKVDPRTGLRIGDALGFCVRFINGESDQSFNSGFTPEQVQVMTDQIALQKAVGINCFY